LRVNGEKKEVRFWIRKNIRKQDIITAAVGLIIAVIVWIAVIGPTYHQDDPYEVLSSFTQ
jgi:uncharacterized membrane protein YvbJ